MDDTKLNSNTLNSVFDPLFCMIFMLAIRYFVSHPQSFIGKFLHKRGWQLTGLRQVRSKFAQFYLYAPSMQSTTIPTTYFQI